jgi:hypothetical protein
LAGRGRPETTTNGAAPLQALPFSLPLPLTVAGGHLPAVGTSAFAVVLE